MPAMAPIAGRSGRGRPCGHPHGRIRLARAAAWAVIAVLAVLACSLAWAKDLTRKWYLGGTLTYHTTEDEIGSNAEMALDPRPDDFASREVAIEDTVRFDLAAGFGFSKWFSLQLEVGYFEGDVGPLEAYMVDRFPVSTSPLQPEVLSITQERDMVIPMQAGRLTEIPVSLSGIVRFRSDRPLNPYIGAGAGVIFTEIEPSSELDALNLRLGSLHITGIVNENRVAITPPRGSGEVPFTFPVKLDAEDAHEVHVLAGLEYFFSDRLSFVADARYTFADRSVSIEMNGEDQIDLLIFSEMLFRPDGSLKIFNDARLPPNPLVDPNTPLAGRVGCELNTIGDFDMDGNNTDLCYHNIPSSRNDDPNGTVVVQGGEINLSGYSIRLGIRFTF